jgi:signal-transduction protein with cAMP-binding, CBS, and nucleotidyltransferase domain
MQCFDKIKLQANSTIKQALSIIDSGAMQIALVVDKDNKLLGTVTDGDIRRGLLRHLLTHKSNQAPLIYEPFVRQIRNLEFAESLPRYF